MDDLDVKRLEMTRELRAARTWLLVVALLMFAFDMIFTLAVKMPSGLADAPAEYKNTTIGLAIFILACFLVLWFFSKLKPKLCLTIALLLYWVIQIGGAAYSGDMSILYKGIIIKVLFTMALVKGIKSAGRAERLNEEIHRVFE